MNGLTLTLIQRDRIEHTIRRQAGELSSALEGVGIGAAKIATPSSRRCAHLWIGDVHGRADLLQRLLSVIDRTLVSHPVKNVVQVLLGDYIDRGPNSREVIETLVTRARRQPMIYPPEQSRELRRAISQKSVDPHRVAAPWRRKHAALVWLEGAKGRRPDCAAKDRDGISQGVAGKPIAASLVSRYPTHAAISFLPMPA